MPIELPPISRRQFLRRSLIAGFGLATAHNLLASVRPIDSNFWALLSDTHLAADRAQLAKGINMADHLEQVSRDLLYRCRNARLVCLSPEIAL